MQTEIELKSLLEHLLSEDGGAINVGGFTIHVHIHQESRALYFTTPVYYGGNYIPQSVRQAVGELSPFMKDFPFAKLSLSEEEFSVTLHDQEALSSINNPTIFVRLIEDFVSLADQWRDLLDEHDQNDRVYASMQ